MNLSDYISLTLTEIAKGVRKINESHEIMRGGRVLTKTPTDVNGIPHTWEREGNELIRIPIIKVGFRVGVELEESSEGNSEIGGSLKVVSANIGSLTKDVEKNIHEVSFELPLILPE